MTKAENEELKATEATDYVVEAPSQQKEGLIAQRIVRFGTISLDSASTGVELEAITFRVADNPNFNPTTDQWFSWTGHGGGGGLKPPPGQACHLQVMQSWKSMDLVAGTTYYRNAVVFYNIRGGTTRMSITEMRTFVA